MFFILSFSDPREKDTSFPILAEGRYCLYKFKSNLAGSISSEYREVEAQKLDRSIPDHRSPILFFLFFFFFARSLLRIVIAGYTCKSGPRGLPPMGFVGRTRAVRSTQIIRATGILLPPFLLSPPCFTYTPRPLPPFLSAYNARVLTYTIPANLSNNLAISQIRPDNLRLLFHSCD